MVGALASVELIVHVDLTHEVFLLVDERWLWQVWHLQVFINICKELARGQLKVHVDRGTAPHRFSFTIVLLWRASSASGFKSVHANA